MDAAELRRIRLSQLLDLAQTYRRWTRKELAKALGRDPTKLIPGTGIPKLDLVVELGRVLDWRVGDVINFLCPEPDQAEWPANGDFETLDNAARSAHREGRYAEMVDLSRRAFQSARTPEERAQACNREAGGWDGLGRYTNVLDAAQRGLAQSPVAQEYRRILQVNLANAYYTLWSLVESQAISGELLHWFASNPASSKRDRVTEAFAYYVAGNTHRRLLSVEPTRVAELAEAALAELRRSRELHEALSRDYDDPAYLGIANTCEGAIAEVEVELGRRSAEDALALYLRGLDEVWQAPEGTIAGDRLESYAWWCIFGCNIALRHLREERHLQQYMAVFTNKADEIAEKLDNWSIRERVFTMEHSRWERAVGCTGFDIPRIVDEDDVRIIAGTMARFPSFQEIGWKILRSAKVVRNG